MARCTWAGRRGSGEGEVRGTVWEDLYAYATQHMYNGDNRHIRPFCLHMTALGRRAEELRAASPVFQQSSDPWLCSWRWPRAVAYYYPAPVFFSKTARVDRKYIWKAGWPELLEWQWPERLLPWFFSACFSTNGQQTSWFSFKKRASEILLSQSPSNSARTSGSIDREEFCSIIPILYQLRDLASQSHNLPWHGETLNTFWFFFNSARLRQATDPAGVWLHMHMPRWHSASAGKELVEVRCSDLVIRHDFQNLSNFSGDHWYPVITFSISKNSLSDWVKHWAKKPASL